MLSWTLLCWTSAAILPADSSASGYRITCAAIGTVRRAALYQTVADRLGKTRDEAKHDVMVMLFGKPWHHNAVSRVLEGLFPTVMRRMAEIKRPDHRRLAHFAQRVESGFMFGRVVPRIMELRPDLFIATIHDSILTTAGDAEFVRQVMLDEFAARRVTAGEDGNAMLKKIRTRPLTEMPISDIK